MINKEAIEYNKNLREYMRITDKNSEYKFLKENYEGKKVGIVAHRAPQLAFEVLTKGISWKEANKNDWRKTNSWQPGWEYIIR